MLIGLALRTGVPIYLPLPVSFYAVLSNTSSVGASAEAASSAIETKSSQLTQDATFALAMAARTGVIATFPEVRKAFTCLVHTFSVCMQDMIEFSSHIFEYLLLQPALDLLSYNEVRGLLTGEAGYGPPSVLLLHRHATYEAPLCAEDPHIMVSFCKNCTFFNDTTLCLN